MQTDSSSSTVTANTMSASPFKSQLVHPNDVVYSSRYSPPTYSFDSPNSDSVSNSNSDHRVYHSRTVQEHQEIVNRHSLYLTRLREATGEVESLHQENNHLHPLLRSSATSNNFTTVASFSAIDAAFRRLRIDGGMNEGSDQYQIPWDDVAMPDLIESPTSVIESGRIQSVDVERFSLPKSISVSSDGYLKNNHAHHQPAAGSSSTTETATRPRPASPLNATEREQPAIHHHRDSKTTIYHGDSKTVINDPPPLRSTDEKERQLEKEIKIAIIDTGIKYQFSVFLLKESEIKERKLKWDDIRLKDTKIQKPDIYLNEDSFKDGCGHGTQCASVAAGTKSDIILLNTFHETIVGSAPSARIYPYKSYTDVRNHEILEGFRAAIKQKVDVISLSIAFIEPRTYNGLNDIVIGSFLATKANILTVACAGNDGPFEETVKNAAPWILTVGASLSKRRFITSLSIDGSQYEGYSIISKAIKDLPLVVFPHNESPKEQLEEQLKGKIVLCDSKEDKEMAQQVGVACVLYRNEDHPPFAEAPENVPSVYLTHKVAKDIGDYLSEKCDNGISIKATIGISNRVDNPDPNKVADFSGRGPSAYAREILKPDICAPGVEVFVPDIEHALNDQYCITEGTSFACALVAAKAALIKKKFENEPDFSPAWMLSALMTTAINNLPQQISIFGEGAGFLNSEQAMDPGLVFNCSVNDHAKFLRGQGVKKKLTMMYEYQDSLPEKIKPYELNYPSIMVEIPKKTPRHECSIPRVLTCVRTLGSFGNYTAEIRDKAEGIEIKIEPQQLLFTPENSVQSFLVKLTVDIKRWEGDLFVTHLVWKKEHHTVTSPIVIARAVFLEKLVKAAKAKKDSRKRKRS